MRKKERQHKFFEYQSSSFGGATLRGNPRQARPLHSKKTLHLVLKSSLCKGKWSLLNKNYAKRVQATLNFYAIKNGIKIYRYQNVGNHLHLMLYGVCPRNYKAFVRSVTGRIAQNLLKDMGYKAQGGKEKKAASIQFWDHRPFSRVVSWGRDFLGVADYTLKNGLDILGLARTEENLQTLKKSLQIPLAQAPPVHVRRLQLEFLPI